jgi:hypothetical protein
LSAIVWGDKKGRPWELHTLDYMVSWEILQIHRVVVSIMTIWSVGFRQWKKDEKDASWMIATTGLGSLREFSGTYWHRLLLLDSSRLEELAGVLGKQTI